MDSFDLEKQYKFYLHLNKQHEDDLHPEQKKQLKQAFYGASGMFLLMLKNDLSKLSTKQALEVMDNIEKQVGDFFENEVKKYNDKK